MKRSLIRVGMVSACAAALASVGGALPASAATPSWGTAVNISSTTTDSTVPQVALSTDGTKATAIWRRLGTNWVVDTRSSTVVGNAATWGGSSTRSSTSTTADEPQVAVSSDGTKAIAVWTVVDSTHTLVQAATATVSGNVPTWSAAVNLTDNTQDAGAPEVALSTDGTKATVVWRRFNGTATTIESKSATIASNTATWGTVATLSDGTNAADNPHLMMSTDGTKATAVWKGSDGTHTVIQSASATISGNTATWSTVTNLSDNTEDAAEPQISGSADGLAAVAIWRRSDGTHTVVQSAAATISGNTAAWGTVSNLSDNTQDATAPQIARASSATTAIATWRRNDGTNWVIQSAVATFAGNVATWGTVANLSNNAQSAETPQIAISAGGAKGVAVWKRSNGSRDVVQSALVTISGTTGTWSAVTDLSESSQHAELPQISLSSSGDKAIAVWRRYSGEHWVVQARTYGNPDELPPNGANTDLLVGIGAALLGAGALLMLTRRFRANTTR